uniref:Shugoshin C-terminal domain-containing protein n=1 Tax=Musa acuminata subsp. malaccensis TaxID=214687 RepID=A0A804HVI2_MUSAM|nr:PREDICTED: shugoshin-1-like isoform X3 [Musa acuminata subsp. malaccensis]
MDGGVRARSLINADSGATGANHGRENTQKRPLMGSSVRRNGLSDITNTVSSAGIGISRTSCSDDDKENANVMPSPRPKDCISQLMKENTSLLKLLAERNEIIRLSSIELQKLELQLQKTNQQNWQLARANSQMLAELNLGKDRLKALQHELGCTRAALKLKTSELEEGGTNHGEVAAGAFTTTDKKTSNLNRKCKLKAQCSATLTHQVPSEEKVDGRRLSLRRRSINLTPESYQPVESLRTIEDVKVPVQSIGESSDENISIQLDSANGSMIQVKNEEEDLSGSPKLVNEELQRRSSFGRPLRKAAEKVSSYKEMSLKSKMRRMG